MSSFKSVVRQCLKCQTPISECFGFVIARDILPVLAGKATHQPRELCGRCQARFLVNPQTIQEIEAMLAQAPPQLL